MCDKRGFATEQRPRRQPNPISSRLRTALNSSAELNSPAATRRRTELLQHAKKTLAHASRTTRYGADHVYPDLFK
ncbi:hypothetical protein Aduo_018889 [Ancylostoma duodenale]